MDRDIPAAEANRFFSRVLREVEEGQTYIVTSHGRPVARISPVTEAGERLAARKAAFDTLLERAARQPVITGGRITRDELYGDDPPLNP